MADPTPEVSVVVPCYNEEEVLHTTIDRLLSACRSTGRSYEILLVNDGSRDRTWTIIQERSSQEPRVKGIDLSRNFGHQAALTAGLQFARGARVLTIDADLQDPPELLPAMLELMDKGADVVYGQRRTRSGEPIWRLHSIRWFYRLLNFLAEREIPPDTGDFRLMQRRVVDELVRMPEQGRYLRGMTSWLGFRQEPLLYDREERFAGESKYPLGKLVRLALEGITGFSVKPLRLATWLGLSMAGASICGIAYFLAAFLIGSTAPPGWMSLMLAMLLIGSLQLIVLGLIGEYLGKIFLEVKRRPHFLVQATCNMNQDRNR